MKEKTVDLGKIKDADLIRTREFGKVWSWVIYGVGAICSLFHLYCLLLRPIDPWYFRGMHIVFLGFLCFLLYPGWEKARQEGASCRLRLYAHDYYPFRLHGDQL